MNERIAGPSGSVAAGILQDLNGMQANEPGGEKSAEQASAPVAGDDVIALDGAFDYEGYQVVRREFFAHINEPSATFNNYKFYVNAACLGRFPEVDYVQVLVNQERKILAIRPCAEQERDSFAWATPAKGKRHARQITCRLFFAKVFSMMGWNPDYRYKLLGKVIHANGEWLIAFDLTATEIYQRVTKDGEKPRTARKPVFPEGWQNQFGLPFAEHQKSLQVDRFEGYAVYGIRDADAAASAAETPKDVLAVLNEQQGGIAP